MIADIVLKINNISGAKVKQEDHQQQYGVSSYKEIKNDRSSYQEHPYYTLLGIKPCASDSEVKTAYRKMYHLYHPDKFSSLNDQQFINLAELKFNLIQKAYNRICMERGL